MDIITLYLLLGVASGVLHPAQGCKILVFIYDKTKKLLPDAPSLGPSSVVTQHINRLFDSFGETLRNMR